MFGCVIYTERFLNIRQNNGKVLAVPICYNIHKIANKTSSIGTVPIPSDTNKMRILNLELLISYLAMELNS